MSASFDFKHGVRGAALYVPGRVDYSSASAAAPSSPTLAFGGTTARGYNRRNTTATPLLLHAQPWRSFLLCKRFDGEHV